MDADLIEGPGGEPLITPDAVRARVAMDSSLVVLQAHNGRFLGRVLEVKPKKAEFQVIARILDGSALWTGRRGHPLPREGRTVTNQERLIKAQSIERRQRAGKLTPEAAALEFDELLMGEDPAGTLIYYSDSTGLTAEWDGDVMLFPKVGATPENKIPSNTGIYARGPQRGNLVTHPAGAVPDCDPVCLEHFRKGSKGWIGGPAVS